MKRREFIKNTALALSSAAVLSGCANKKIIVKEGEVAKRKFKDLDIPLLGMGCMRLPMQKNAPDKIDMAELEKMVEYCLNHGINYFDTAYMYVNSESENAMGEVLSKYKRSDYILADKSPIYKMKETSDIRNCNSI